MTFSETIQCGRPILTEGAMVERIRRHPGVELDPDIAHAGLIYSDSGRKVLTEIYQQYLSIGQRHNLPMLTLAPTWRANPERIARADSGAVDKVNADCIEFLKEICAGYGSYQERLFVAGLLGCRHDAYNPDEALSSDAAEQFHAPQVEALANSGVDFIKAATLPAVSEALGIARAIARTGLPGVLSFVIRPTGQVLDGTPLHTAVALIDSATNPAPAFYMVNCVHPTVFMHAMTAETKADSKLTERVLGFQGNTSTKSPEELDNLPYLDTTEPESFANLMVQIHGTFGTRVLGGCCGTDESHIAQVAARLAKETP